jgi:hypothetical protein
MSFCSHYLWPLLRRLRLLRHLHLRLAAQK